MEQQDLLHGYERSKQVKQFNLYLDEDKIIRYKSRINNADTTEESKNTVLLPSHHRYTELSIRERHDHVHHNGVRETLNAIRETHWVLKGREAVKRVITKCTKCRRYEGKPFTAPPSSDLPTDRVYEGPPFTYTGWILWDHFMSILRHLRTTAKHTVAFLHVHQHVLSTLS